MHQTSRWTGGLVAALVFAANCGDDGGPPTDALDSVAEAEPDAAGDETDAVEVAEHAEGGDAGIDCTAALGSGSLSGTVGGETLAASHAGAVEFSVLGLRGYMVAFTAESGTCAEGATLMESAPLALQLCNVTPGDHAVGESCVPDGGGMSISASVKLQRAGDDVSADSGTITIDEFDASCAGRVRGHFTADFAGETVTGTFDTVGCGSVAL